MTFFYTTLTHIYFEKTVMTRVEPALKQRAVRTLPAKSRGSALATLNGRRHPYAGASAPLLGHQFCTRDEGTTMRTRAAWPALRSVWLWTRASACSEAALRRVSAALRRVSAAGMRHC